MADWTTVAASADVEEGGLTEIDNRGEPVVIARRRGDLYAFEGWCTHEECPLVEGQFTDFEIECYCHGSYFDIRSGEALVGPAVESLETYRVREQDGQIQVEL
jgi:3-phenylpropionate/trans-cinnamate dioxygenase ferredoxin subunit